MPTTNRQMYFTAVETMELVKMTVFHGVQKSSRDCNTAKQYL